MDKCINFSPTVSIIIPLYNAQKDILNCLNSVKRQIFNDYEIIIIDDGSTDNSVNIVKNFVEGNKDLNIHLLQQKNSGPSKARNKGVNCARGKYIAFLDSDDEWYEDKLSTIVSILDMDDSVCLISSLYTIGEKVVFHKCCGKCEVISLKKLLFKNYFFTTGTVCRSEVMKKYSFNEDQKYSEDYRLWLDICADKYKCVLLHKVLIKMNSKPIYGCSGLASKMKDMLRGEYANYKDLYIKSKISIWLVIASCVFATLKYVRRVIIVNLRKI